MINPTAQALLVTYKKYMEEGEIEKAQSIRWIIEYYNDIYKEVFLPVEVK